VLGIVMPPQQGAAPPVAAGGLSCAHKLRTVRKREVRHELNCRGGNLERLTGLTCLRPMSIDPLIGVLAVFLVVMAMLFAVRVSLPDVYTGPGCNAP
jgi:hypothetical protein